MSYLCTIRFSNTERFSPLALFPFKYAILLLSLIKKESFNSIQDGGRGGWGGIPPIKFSPVTSTNGGIHPKNLLTFSFKRFGRLV